MKHIGKVNNTGTRVVVVFRVVPNEPQNCLVIYSDSLPNVYHDGVMNLVESEQGQQEFELGNYLARRMFVDGNYVLTTLHNGNFIHKMATDNVTMTPGGKQEIPLTALNKLIAEQKNVTVEQLAGTIDKTQSEIAANDQAASYTGTGSSQTISANIGAGLDDRNFDGGPTLAENQDGLTNEMLAENILKQSEALAKQVKQLLDESKRLQSEAYDLNPALKLAAKKKAPAVKKKA